MGSAKKAYYRLADYILFALVAAMGIAVKSFVTPVFHLVTGPLFIPGGVAAGGFYMLFPILARAVTGKRGGALLTSMVQAALVMATGAPGTHGAASLLTYSLPGLTIEAVWLLSFRQAGGPVCCFIAGICANMAGNMAVNLLLFNLPAAPLLLALCVAALSGGLGGWAAYGLGLQIRRSGAWKAQPPSLGSGGAGGKAG